MYIRYRYAAIGMIIKFCLCATVFQLLLLVQQLQVDVCSSIKAINLFSYVWLDTLVFTKVITIGHVLTVRIYLEGLYKNYFSSSINVSILAFILYKIHVHIIHF